LKTFRQHIKKVFGFYEAHVDCWIDQSLTVRHHAEMPREDGDSKNAKKANSDRSQLAERIYPARKYSLDLIKTRTMRESLELVMLTNEPTVPDGG